ncbi:MAG TPA: ethylbenzene dehydrogenase-related protein [Chloroflexia bacterium]|nr:ethylbenzene dehydrogenase-related protein [Chloroflexia bacterium]
MSRSSIREAFRTNPRLRVGGLLAVFVAAGVLFSLLDISLVRAATAAISVHRLTSANTSVPGADPFSPLWKAAPPADIPLSAQQMYQPGGGGSVQSVQVRALQDGEQIAFLVSWADTTRNDYVKDMPSDAAAIQLPIEPDHLPYQCMGQSDSRVNIWQWKAALEQVAIAAHEPNNGTRNLTSNGICKAVDTEGIIPTATSAWRDGRWYVVYQRRLAPSDLGTAPLMPGEPTNAAFAIWDGGKGETRGMKSVSTWIPVEINAGEEDGASGLITLALAGLAGAGVVALAWRLIPH